MTSWAVAFWLGAVLLGGLGGVMLARGLFGHRLIASRTRKCPACQYDMTAHAASQMTCPECGFGAKDEADWYRGVRRPFCVVSGLLALLIAFGIGSRPTARQTGYLAFLPLSVQVRIWPEWRVAWREFGSDTSRDWDSLLVGIGNVHLREDRVPVSRAAYTECMGVLRRKPGGSWLVENAGILLERLSLFRLSPAELDFVTDGDVYYLMNHVNPRVAEVGVHLASRLTSRTPALIDALFEWKPQDARVQINTAQLAYAADRLNGRRCFDRALGSDDPAKIRRALDLLMRSVLENEEEYEYVLFWLTNGPPETRLRIAESLCSLSLLRFGDVVEAQLMRREPQMVRAETLVALMFDLMEEIASDPKMLNRMRSLRPAGALVVMQGAHRLGTTDSAEVAETIIWMLSTRGESAQFALPALERFAQDPRWPEALRAKAEQASRRIRGPSDQSRLRERLTG